MLGDLQAKWKKRKVSKNLILIDKKIHKAKRILFKKKNEDNKKRKRREGKRREEKRREDRIRKEEKRQDKRKEKKRKEKMKRDEENWKMRIDEEE